ncbi:MAG: alanine racemase [Bacteroidales bacterium]|jgi:predicted amino acid racemase|nr:alanine racemase [Bacteroidales bacterium]
MAELVVKTENIIRNIIKLDDFLKGHDIQWSLVSKVLSGDINFLKKILTDDVVQRIHSIGDSRLSSLKTIKKINPDLITVYIKPPAQSLIHNIIQYADITVNTSYKTIEALSKEAIKQKKTHKVIIFIELGELREGVVRENIVDFYKKVFNLPHIEIIGIGSNLGCMYGIEPTYDKLLQLSLFKQLLEQMFNKKIPLISGGSSITLPLINKKLVPKAVNHFRIGESVFFGTSPLNNKKFKTLSTDTFSFNANIIELEEKNNIPDGIISDANIGHTSELAINESAFKSYRAILDFGILDVDVKDINPKDKNLAFVGTTSDMTVYDIGRNIDAQLKSKYQVGKKISFNPNYMATARLMHSKFIDLKIE